MLETIQAKSKRTFPPIDPSAIVFSPFAHSFDYAAKGQVWRKTWAAIDRLKRGCETRLSFFLFLLARKNHRIIKIKKTISPRTDHFITSQLILSQRMARLEVKR